MPVTFHIPGALREFTAGHSRVEIEHSPTTLADALSLDTLPGRSRSYRNGARTSAGTYQHFHWGRKCPIYRWTRESRLRRI